MLTKGAKLMHWTLHLQRDFGKWSCVSRQSYSTSQRLTYLHNSVTKAELCLVGIDHVSQKSVEHVQHAIRQFKPSVVAVELCKERALTLNEKPKATSWRDLFEMEGHWKGRLVEFSVVSFYSYLAAKDTNSSCGDEMRVAIKEGQDLGARIMYIDQDIDVTFSKVSEGISVWTVLKLLWKGRGALKQHPNVRDEMEKIGMGLLLLGKGKLSMEEFGQRMDAFLESGTVEEAIELADQHVPGLMKSLIHERDEYMVANLRRLHGKVLAVVGAYHVPGMCKLWQDAEIQVKRKQLRATGTRTQSKSTRGR